MVENRRDNLILIYNEINATLRHQESLLFQRLNYFLIAVAFITAAFSTLITNYLNHIGNVALFIITLLISVTGFMVSWSFIVINYHNSQIIRYINLYIERVEQELEDGIYRPDRLPHTYLINTILRERIFNPGLNGLFTIPFRGLHPLGYIMRIEPIARFFNKGSKRADIDMPAPTTWLVPTIFAIIWLIAIIVFIYFAFNPIWQFPPKA
jgi:hypothetical protein